MTNITLKGPRSAGGFGWIQGRRIGTGKVEIWRQEKTIRDCNAREARSRFLAFFLLPRKYGIFSFPARRDSDHNDCNDGNVAAKELPKGTFPLLPAAEQ